LFQNFGKKEKDLLSQGVFDLLLMLECMDACTPVNGDVSYWSHGFVEMSSHTQFMDIRSGSEQA